MGRGAGGAGGGVEFFFAKRNMVMGPGPRAGGGGIQIEYITFQDRP
jgi:hypothetical protein